MISYEVRSCDYCRRSISMGRRWVREKIYEPPRPNELSAYRHFHAESFGGTGSELFGKILDGTKTCSSSRSGWEDGHGASGNLC